MKKSANHNRYREKINSFHRVEKMRENPQIIMAESNLLNHHIYGGQ